MAKVMVSFPTQFLSNVDRAARPQGRFRIELIREALRVSLGDRNVQRSWKRAVAPLREFEALWLGD
jgi:metal-responsive CopG/Arc/MetJ family transcriptional regulator